MSDASSSAIDEFTSGSFVEPANSKTLNEKHMLGRNNVQAGSHVLLVDNEQTPRKVSTN